MADKPDFTKIFGSKSPLTPYNWTDEQYEQGWNVIGSIPPARTQFDALQRLSDQKLLWLLENFANYLPIAGGTLEGWLHMAKGQSIIYESNGGSGEVGTSIDHPLADTIRFSQWAQQAGSIGNPISLNAKTGAITGTTFSGKATTAGTADNAGWATGAGYASKLQTARTINGVAFDGTKNITISSGITAAIESSSVSNANAWWVKFAGNPGLIIQGGRGKTGNITQFPIYFPNSILGAWATYVMQGFDYSVSQSTGVFINRQQIKTDFGSNSGTQGYWLTIGY